MTFEPDPVLTVELIKQGLDQGKLPYATVTSNSMSPLFIQGDEVQIAPLNAARLKPGIVILLTSPAGLFAHRYWQSLSQPEGTFIITRGDRLPEFDPPTSDSCLVGEVVARRRGSRQLSLTNGPGGWLNRSLATFSRWDARLRNMDVVDLELKNMSPSREGHRYEQQSLGTRIASRLLYTLAIVMTGLVSATSKS